MDKTRPQLIGISTRFMIGASIGAVLATLALAVFLWMNIALRVDRAAVLLGELTLDLEKEKRLSELKNFVRGTETKSKKLDGYFLAPSGVAPLIGRIESLGAHAGILVEFTNVLVDVDKKILILQFETLGNFSGTYYFLSLAETLPLKLSFEKVFIDKDIPRGVGVRSADDTWRGVFSVAVLSYTPATE